MPSPKPPVELKKAGGDPQITVILGKMQGGSYTVRLTPKKGEPETFDGQNDDDIVDTHSLGKVAGLNSALLSWRILMSASSEGPGQQFMATVIITQDGVPAKNGVYQYPSSSVFDIVRLAVS